MDPEGSSPSDLSFIEEELRVSRQGRDSLSTNGLDASRNALDEQPPLILFSSRTAASVPPTTNDLYLHSGHKELVELRCSEQEERDDARVDIKIDDRWEPTTLGGCSLSDGWGARMHEPIITENSDTILMRTCVAPDMPTRTAARTNGLMNGNKDIPHILDFLQSVQPAYATRKASLGGLSSSSSNLQLFDHCPVSSPSQLSIQDQASLSPTITRLPALSPSSILRKESFVGTPKTTRNLERNLEPFKHPEGAGKRNENRKKQEYGFEKKGAKSSDGSDSIALSLSHRSRVPMQMEKRPKASFTSVRQPETPEGSKPIEGLNSSPTSLSPRHTSSHSRSNVSVLSSDNLSPVSTLCRRSVSLSMPHLPRPSSRPRPIEEATRLASKSLPPSTLKIAKDDINASSTQLLDTRPHSPSIVASENYHITVELKAVKESSLPLDICDRKIASRPDTADPFDGGSDFSEDEDPSGIGTTPYSASAIVAASSQPHFHGSGVVTVSDHGSYKKEVLQQSTREVLQGSVKSSLKNDYRRHSLVPRPTSSIVAAPLSIQSQTPTLSSLSTCPDSSPGFLSYQPLTLVHIRKPLRGDISVDPSAFDSNDLNQLSSAHAEPFLRMRQVIAETSVPPDETFATYTMDKHVVELTSSRLSAQESNLLKDVFEPSFGDNREELIVEKLLLKEESILGDAQWSRSISPLVLPTSSPSPGKRPFSCSSPVVLSSEGGDGEPGALLISPASSKFLRTNLFKIRPEVLRQNTAIVLSMGEYLSEMRRKNENKPCITFSRSSTRSVSIGISNSNIPSENHPVFSDLVWERRAPLVPFGLISTKAVSVPTEIYDIPIDTSCPLAQRIPFFQSAIHLPTGTKSMDEPCVKEPSEFPTTASSSSLLLEAKPVIPHPAIAYSPLPNRSVPSIPSVPFSSGESSDPETTSRASLPITSIHTLSPTISPSTPAPPTGSHSALNASLLSSCDDRLDARPPFSPFTSQYSTLMPARKAYVEIVHPPGHAERRKRSGALILSYGVAGGENVSDDELVWDPRVKKQASNLRLGSRAYRKRKRDAASEDGSDEWKASINDSLRMQNGSPKKPAHKRIKLSGEAVVGPVNYIPGPKGRTVDVAIGPSIDEIDSSQIMPRTVIAGTQQMCHQCRNTSTMFKPRSKCGNEQNGIRCPKVFCARCLQFWYGMDDDAITYVVHGQRKADGSKGTGLGFGVFEDIWICPWCCDMCMCTVCWRKRGGRRVRLQPSARAVYTGQWVSCSTAANGQAKHAATLSRKTLSRSQKRREHLAASPAWKIMSPTPAARLSTVSHQTTRPCSRDFPLGAPVPTSTSYAPIVVRRGNRLENDGLDDCFTGSEGDSDQCNFSSVTRRKNHGGDCKEPSLLEQHGPVLAQRKNYAIVIPGKKLPAPRKAVIPERAIKVLSSTGTNGAPIDHLAAIDEMVIQTPSPNCTESKLVSQASDGPVLCRSGHTDEVEQPYPTLDPSGQDLDSMHVGTPLLKLSTHTSSSLGPFDAPHEPLRVPISSAITLPSSIHPCSPYASPLSLLDEPLATDSMPPTHASLDLRLGQTVDESLVESSFSDFEQWIELPKSPQNLQTREPHRIHASPQLE